MCLLANLSSLGVDIDMFEKKLSQQKRKQEYTTSHKKPPSAKPP